MRKPFGIIGWDIGGAHVKLARATAHGRVQDVELYPCALWQGLAKLEELLAELHARHDLSRYRHAVTMTGELVDIFPDRRRGVRSLLSCLLRRLNESGLRVYTLRHGLRSVAYARANSAEVASANWHATARVIAMHRANALLVDIGSTTTDIVPIIRGRVDARGYTDGDRLRHGELLYTGAVRTPLMAVADCLPFRGEWHGIAAEWFATMGDVYVLTGHLTRKHYQSTTADRGGLQTGDCARRLARVLGRDSSEAAPADWRCLAQHVAGVHMQTVRSAVERVLSRYDASGDFAIAGAGCGRFIARNIARALRCSYVDVADLLRIPARCRDMAAVCAPAVAVAILAR